MARQRFLNQVVFATGGTSGLEADTCELFIDEGAKVFVTDLEERGILTRLGPEKATFQRCDVSNPEDCHKAVEACIKKYGRLDVLFHNGAMLAGVATVVDHDLAAFQRVINTNLCSLFYLARVAIPQMRKQGKGVIVSTASTAGLRGDSGLCSYNAAKAGMINLTRTMAIDHISEGIRINCVCPGYMVTTMTTAFREDTFIHDMLRERIPAGRGSDPKEVGRAVLFLASDEASYITGQGTSSMTLFTAQAKGHVVALVADGGWTAQSGGPNFLRYMGPEVSLCSFSTLNTGNVSRSCLTFRGRVES